MTPEEYRQKWQELQSCGVTAAMVGHRLSFVMGRFQLVYEDVQIQSGDAVTRQLNGLKRRDKVAKAMLHAHGFLSLLDPATADGATVVYRFKLGEIA